MLTLFSAEGTCALASHIALNETEAQYELRMLSFARQEELAPDYLKINAKGRVPALATEEGVLTESPAILGYIAMRFPDSAVGLPASLFETGRIQSFNSYLCATVHVSHAHRMRGSRWADDPAAIAEMKRKVPETVAAGFQLIEDELLTGPWVMGQQYSICDPYLYTLASWLEGDGVDRQNFPKVQEHFERMQKRPAVIKALADQTA